MDNRGNGETNLRTHIHTSITNGHRQQCSEDLGLGRGWKERKKGENLEDICYNVNDKMKSNKKCGFLSRSRLSGNCELCSIHYPLFFF